MKTLPKKISSVGIVGCEAAKFTPQTEKRARASIRELIRNAKLVVSGACHLGGVDIWAIEEAKKLGIPTKEFAPEKKHWEGYKARNIQIAEASDKVYCITVRKLPKTYKGMRFPLCYHCGTTNHIKSGGCWTVKYAKKIGKRGMIIVVEE